VDLKRKVSSLPCPLDHPIETVRRKWTTAFAHKQERRLWRFALKLAERSQLIAANWMGARLAILHSADMQRG